jgi:tetratricopeptide (TPR) repeat protein
MSFLGKLLGKKKESPSPEVKPTAPAPASDENLIKVYDEYGREALITRQQWRDSVLPGTIKNVWNDPDGLSTLIIQSFQDRFFEEMLQPAQRLCEIDPIKERATTLLGIVYLKLKKLDEAEKTFTDFIKKHGETGSILTNLAKVQSARGNDALSLETLWRGLQIDPNQDNGMGWYEVIHREKGGEEAGLESLRRVAAIPGSWRAQLWLGREVLQKRDLSGAMQFYQEALTRAPRPVPADLLMQMSGDLGNLGYLPEIVQLVEPHFNIEIHGLQVGNNLIKANLDMGQIDAARQILDKLYAQKRPDWTPHLNFWDTEIAKLRVSTSDTPQKESISMAILTIAGPVWLRSDSPAAELFPIKALTSPIISFLGSSVEKKNPGEEIQQQLSDAPGRLSRMLPLFLSEKVHFGTEARVQTLVPWLVGESSGFVLSGEIWGDDSVQPLGIKSDYHIITHLVATSNPWIIQLRLVRTIDSKCLGTIETKLQATTPQASIPELALQTIELLKAHAELKTEIFPSAYQIPGEDSFLYYLLRLEQLLAVRCGGMDGINPHFLSGEREIIQGNIQQCLSFPQSIPARIVLAQTLLSMKKVRRDILPEFKDQVTMLQKEKPLSEPAQGVIERLVNEALAI